MCTPRNLLRDFARITVVAIGVSLGAASHAKPDVTIQVWKIGSPHSGDIPPSTVPAALRQQLAARGIAIQVQSFPARGFARLFSEAVARNAAPDALAFDNFGVIDGIVVNGERFAGIAEDPVIRRDLIRVTGAYDDLLGPARGWVYLYSPSANHEAARAFALSTPSCGADPSIRDSASDFVELAPMLASAYLEGDAGTLQAHADAERISRWPLIRQPVKVGAALGCGVWGNSKLAFVRVLASYRGEDAIGRLPVLVVLRKTSAGWQLLVVSRDPITNGVFTRQLGALTRLLGKESPSSLPLAATEMQPSDRLFPRPPAGLRFGAFSWRSSQSDDVVAEIGEFAYKDDARLSVRLSVRPGSRGEFSTGLLWTTRDWWSWRVWSIARGGDVSFSEARSFYH